MTALFKFCTASGAIKILEGNSIFITSPLDLNDPFEMRPAWTDEHEARRHDNEQLRSVLTQRIPLYVVTQGDKVVPTGIMPGVPLNPKLDVEGMRGISDHLNEGVFSLLQNHFRVLSLAGSLFDLNDQGGESDEQATLMWSHYAEQFQGICLAVDPTKFGNGIQQGGFEVKYPPERRSLPPSQYDSWLALKEQASGVPGFINDAASGLLLTPSQQNERIKQEFISFLTHKSPAWKYEQEVRMIYEIPNQRWLRDYRRIDFPCSKCQQKGVAAEKCENSWYRDAIELPPDAILAVIFGTDCMMATADTVLSILDAPQYRHVDLYWSSLHSCRYAVQYTKQDRSYIKAMQEERTKQVARAKGHVFHDEKGVSRFSPSPKGVNYDMSKRR